MKICEKIKEYTTHPDLELLKNKKIALIARDSFPKQDVE